jgi:hypothetical protein
MLMVVALKTPSLRCNVGPVFSAIAREINTIFCRGTGEKIRFFSFYRSFFRSAQSTPRGRRAIPSGEITKAKSQIPNGARATVPGAQIS